MKLRNIIPFIAAFCVASPLSHAYEADCGNPGQNDSDCPPVPVGSNPINPHRACLLREVTDIETFGAAPIVFTRHYNSRPRDYTKERWELGTQWTWQHNWQYEIRESSTSDFGFPRLIVRYPEGREYYFQAVDATGSVRVSDASWGDRLYPTSATTYVLRTPEGHEYDFQKVSVSGGYQYLLTEVRNGTGWKWTLTYQTVGSRQRLYRITNNYGRYLQLARTASANGYYRITSVTANDGRSVAYGYSTWAPTSETVLTSVTYPDTTAAAYTWCGAASATTGAPLLATADDPMVSTSGSRMKYAYNYTAAYFTPPYGIVHGTILEERSLVTNQVIVSLPLGSGNYPQVLEGNGTEITRKYENGGLSKEWADGEGRVTTVTRGASGWGYIEHVAEPMGGSTTYTRDYAGRILTRTDAHGKVRTYTYNTAGFLLTEQDEELRTTTHTRGSDNRISRTDHPDGTYETYTYTGTGLVKTHRLRNGYTESWTYDSWGNLATHTDAAGHLWTYTSHTNGLRASVTDPRTFTTGYLYDWRGNLTKLTHPDTSYREYTYTPYGKLWTEKNELGETWTHTYTEYNQLHTKTDPLLRTTTYEYGKEPGCGTCGYLPTLSKITLHSGKVTEFHYDASGRLLWRVAAPGTLDEAVTGYLYDAKGRLEYLTDPRGKITQYTYDLVDRKKTETDPLTHTTEWHYDDVGNVEKITRADTTEIVNTYDTMDRMLTTTNPKSETTTFTYHPDGSLWTLKDARNNIYTYLVDPLSRRARLDYPGGPLRFETWSYDGAGNLEIYRARNGATRTCTYDNRNRDIFCDWSDSSTPDVTKTYDLASRLETATNSVVALGYTYTDAGELETETYNFGGVMGSKTLTYTYDDDGNRESLTYPDGTLVEYTYTQRNQVETISGDGPPPVATYTYDAAGNAVYKQLENGTLATSVWDDANRLETVSHSEGGTDFAGAGYGYNALNLRTGRSQQGEESVTYIYDLADQIEEADGTGTGYEMFLYDAAGNRTWVGSSWTGNQSYNAANARNEYGAYNAKAFFYHAMGHPTQVPLVGGSQFYSYGCDSLGRTSFGGLTPATRINFSYDARNRQVIRSRPITPTYTIYDGWNVIEEYDQNGQQLTRYIHGAGVDELLVKVSSSGARYYHADGLGSTIALTDENGDVVERYAYSAYGVTKFMNAAGSNIGQTAQGNRFLFTGREWFPEMRAYDYRNRTYIPEIGRFLQTDSIRFEAGDVNLYRYVFNSPLNWTDPFGLDNIYMNFTFPEGTTKEQYAGAQRQIEQLQKNLEICKKYGIDLSLVADSGAKNQANFQQPKNPKADGSTNVDRSTGMGTYSDVNPNGDSNTLSHEIGHQGGYTNEQNPGPGKTDGKLDPSKSDPSHSGSKGDLMWPTTNNGGNVDECWCKAMANLAQ